MTTQFRFRNTIDLVPGEYIAAEGNRLVLFSESGVEVVLRPSADNELFPAAARLLLAGGPYPTAEDALKAGMSWRRRLLLACSDRFVGINIGDEAEPHPSRIPLSQTDFPPEAPVLLKDRHGLLVHPESDNPLSAFVSFTADLSVQRPSSELLNAIRDAGAASSTMSARQTLALTLLHASRFDQNPETQYITLVTAIEALLKPARQSATIRAALESCQRHAEELDLSPEELETIIQHIGYGKKESITESGRKLASTLGDKEYGGFDPSTFFGRAYTTRSKLVHGNTSRPTHDELRAELGTLHGFVVDLLHHAIVGT
ncbi:hypothetical protein [Nocardia sp. CA-145437]|uniref:hypothetical protein n=1 Tax=Nocardia sp. CA-145437 TaxID=3239980 RepID=UPI003D973B89